MIPLKLMLEKPVCVGVNGVHTHSPACSGRDKLFMGRARYFKLCEPPMVLHVPSLLSLIPLKM